MAALDSLRAKVAELNERERRLLTALGGVMLAIFVFLPLYLISASISDIQKENEELSDVLQDIQQARTELAQRDVEREAAMGRYRTPAPPLGSFVESKAGEQDLRLREVTDQPEQVLGEFRRRSVRVSMPNVELRPVIKLFTSIENARYPVALERIQVEHYRRDAETYNVELGVITYDRTQAAAADDEDEPTAANRRGRAGPPSL